LSAPEVILALESDNTKSAFLTALLENSQMSRYSQ